MRAQERGTPGVPQGHQAEILQQSMSSRTAGSCLKGTLLAEKCVLQNFPLGEI